MQQWHRTWDRARWYAARLGAMERGELLHRGREAARRVTERRVRSWDAFAVEDGPLGSFEALRARLARAGAGGDGLETILDRLASGAVEHLGRAWPAVATGAPGALPPEAWLVDPVTGRLWPGAEACAFDVDVRSTGPDLGDVKFVWEPNRLQVLHRLAVAVATGGSVPARDAALRLVGSWMAANPPYRGVNWTSGIEVAMRLVSLLVLVAAAGPDGIPAGDRRNLRRFVAAHGRFLLAFRSAHSSANNHLVAEGLGLLVAGLLGPDLPRAGEWEAEGRAILEGEALRQILPDGVGGEQAPTYQAFTMEMLLLGVRLAADAGRPLAAGVEERLARGAEFLARLLDEGGHAPLIGDDDEGRVLAEPGDREPRYVASVVAAVAGLTGRPDLARAPRDAHLRDLVFDSPPPTLDCPDDGVRLFEPGGYTIARETIGGRRAHLVFDHGPLGYRSLAAHGHADALAVWLSLDGTPVFIDAGTYLYFSGRETRTRLRESPAHNTLSIDGASQSRASAAFSWSSRADARLVGAELEGAWTVEGAHGGYARRFGVEHRRRVAREERGYAIADRLLGSRDLLPVSLRFLCDPALSVEARDGAAWIGRSGAPLCRVVPPAGFSLAVEAGMRSARFGHLEPAPCLVLSGRLAADPATTRIEIAS